MSSINCERNPPKLITWAPAGRTHVRHAIRCPGLWLVIHNSSLPKLKEGGSFTPIARRSAVSLGHHCCGVSTSGLGFQSRGARDSLIGGLYYDTTLSCTRCYCDERWGLRPIVCFWLMSCSMGLRCRLAWVVLGLATLLLTCKLGLPGPVCGRSVFQLHL